MNVKSGVIAGLVTIGVLIPVSRAVWGVTHPPPDHGTVFNKQYDAPYDWIQYVNGACDSYTQNGTIRSCTHYQQIPVWEHESPHWYLCLENHDDGKDNKGCREVDETTFHEYEIGDTYPARKQ